MKFFLNVLSTIVGLILFMFIGFFIFVGLIGILSSEPEVRIKNQSVLHLNLNRVIQEQTVDNPFAELGMFGSEVNSPLGLIDLKKALKDASTDPKIEGIYLESNFPIAGFSTLSEIRQSLQEFKDNGKFIVAYGEFYSEQGYYIASIADAVHMFPEGEVELNGLGSEFVSIKNTLEKIGVEPEIFRVGDYKSAVEPFLNEKMSPENREQTESFLNSIYDTVIERIAASRNIELARLHEISDEMLVREPADAVTYKLVDQLSYQDQMYADIKNRLGLEEEADIEFVSVNKYMKVTNTDKYSPNKIAVMVASGNIVSGKAGGGQEIIASDSFNEEIRKLREDESVKAVVLRINSPGGSALASDAMWREIELLKEKKPVITSMSDYAASGGYYMAMGTDYIMAEPTTITGSIGVFGLWFNAERLLNDKLGVNTDYVSTGRYSNFLSLSKPMTEEERQIMQKGVERTYATFTNKAAEGRDMQIEDLLAVASGRVWSGAQAVDNGLVDELGGLDDAVKKAAEMAEVEEYRVLVFPPKVDFIQELINSLNQDVSVRIAKAQLGELYPIMENIKAIKQYEGPQARMPFELRIR
ncbi:signal peptide peptidase SppA [Fulvivirgaceae bacterium LMO-SS25]